MRSGCRLAATLLLVSLPALGGCRDGDELLGPPDSFVLLERAKPVADLVVRRLDLSAPQAEPLARTLADGFGAEMVRTVYLAKQLVRDASLEGRRFPGAKDRPA